ncbi:hypothetical protein F5Y15DRAFT_419903 [Xylariaceae sp. FL0016]|nr:hypothetical protein F5Y15DRAFT_419903 [Xylariaceae sp. FL0016]
MAPPSPLPNYVYKIVPTAPPTPLPSEYPLSELDQKDGFVHLSTATQIPTTASLFFASSTSLHVLKIAFAPKFHEKTNWDVPGCPHLYGNFGVEDVADVQEFTRKEDEGWEEAMMRQGDFLV